MKKSKYYLFIVFIVFLALFCFSINTKALDDTYEPVKGDLKCPDTSSGKCKMYDKNGNELSKPGSNVWTVKIFEKYEDIELVKVVSKVDKQVGKYKVYFDVLSAPVEEHKIMKPAYVVIIFDTSGSIKSSYKNAKDAIINFSKGTKFIESKSKVALVQFASNVKSGASFGDFPLKSNQICDKVAGCGMGSSSHIEKAFEKAYNLLKNVNADSKKYVVVFGDGQYWYQDETCREKCEKSNQCKVNYKSSSCGKKSFEGGLRNLRSLSKIEIFGILYKSSSRASWKRDLTWMGYIDKNYKNARDSTNYTSFFNKIYDSITYDIEQDPITYSFYLNDKIGNHFYLSSGSTVSYINSKTSTEPFYISIDPESDTGWHNSNEGFTVKVDDNKSKFFTDNPQVYWVKNTKNINSCSGTSSFDTEINYQTDYYSVLCNEGYKDDSEVYHNGYSANIVINNLPLGTKKFDASLGFTGSVKLLTNVKCSYNFNKNKFNDKYNSLINSFNASKDEKEKASLQLKIDELKNNVLNKYSSLLNRLNEYKSDFENQSSVMSVIYSNSADNSVINFINNDDLNVNINCSSVAEENILDKRIIVNQVCYMSGSKSMKLPRSCVDIYTYNETDCSSTVESFLDGGNYHYPKKTTNSEIRVTINNAGFNGDTSILLNDCFFGKSYDKLIYRNIDIDDPFIQDYSARERNIGNNWLNSITDSPKYDFTGIIKSDIWSQDYEYKYSLGEKNVDNIQKDTSDDSDKVNSYQGNDCYINDQKKYICEFVREGCDNTIEEEVEFFQYCDIK